MLGFEAALATDLVLVVFQLLIDILFCGLTATLNVRQVLVQVVEEQVLGGCFLLNH